MTTSATVTIEHAALAYLNHLALRKRNKAKESSLQTYRSYLRSRILPLIGNVPLEEFTPLAMKTFIEKLPLAPKSVNEIASLVKQIVRFPKDEQGLPVFPRVWDSEFLDLPEVKHSEQHAPIVTREQIESAIAKSKETYQVLFALASGAGLRIGELLSVKLEEDGVSTVFDSSTATIHVRRSMWRGQETSTKTEAGARDVEIPRVLSDFISSFAGDRKGFLFGNGTSLSASTARAALNKAVGEGVGWHAFRRYFVSFRRAQGMPEDVLKRLVGHASGSDITSLYNRFGNLPAERREWVERIGLGFDLPRDAT